MPTPIVFSGGAQGEWCVTALTTLAGPSIATTERIRIHDGPPHGDHEDTQWKLHGIPSNMRYTTRQELNALARIQPPLGRSGCTCAALIPIRKSAAWWALAQDERRAIFEEDSRHNAIGMRHLPGIARRLLHSRDLSEPFDFLTWFEFAPEAEASFSALLAELRATREWSYVEREIDIRLQKSGA
jgi:hypothetical protein